MSAYTIRPFAATDSVEELTRVVNSAYKQLADLGLRFVGTHQDAAETARRIEGNTCLVAVQDGKLIGTIIIAEGDWPSDPDWYKRPGTRLISQFGVIPEQKGTGVGRALLDAAEKFAFEDGADEAALDTAEDATHLIELYKRRGYRFIQHVDWRPTTNYRSVLLSKRLRPTLTTDRLILREIRLDEVDQIAPFWSSPEFMKNYPSDHWGDEKGRAILRQFAEAAQEFPRLKNRWGIELEGQIIGWIRLDWESVRSRGATLGYGLAVEHWGRGIATEAVREVLRYAFEELRFHRVQAYVFQRNKASARVLEKCGFTYEGSDREGVRWDDGWEDDLRFGILEHEWPAS